MNIFNSEIIIGLSLSIIDIIGMGITKNVVLGILTQNWMIIAFILYGSQMLIFKQGLELTSMTNLNLIWNLFSNIVITLLGLYYFKEKISNLEVYGILFAFISIFLFGLNKYQK